MNEIPSLDESIINFFNSFDIKYYYEIEQKLSESNLSKNEKQHCFNPTNVYGRLRRIYKLEPKREVINFMTMYESLFKKQIYKNEK